MVTIKKQFTGMTLSGCLVVCLIFHGITAMLDLLGLEDFYTKPAGI